MRAATGGDLVCPRRFTAALASGALVGVGEGGGTDESTEDLYRLVPSRLVLDRLGLGYPVSEVWHGVFFLDGVSGKRRCGCAEGGFDIHGGFFDFAGDDDFSEEYELGRSGVFSLELFGLVFCSSLIFSGDTGEAGLYGEDFGRYVYQLEMPGWASVPTFFGGFASPRGSSCVGELEALMCSVRFLSSDDEMASSHLFQLGRSAGTKQVVFDELHKTASRNLCCFTGEEVGFRWCPPTTDDEEDWESTRTEL